MTTFVSVLMVIACFLIVAAILIQPSKGGAVSALGGGSSQSVFGSSGGATFLFKFTMWTGAFIMVGSMWLTRHRITQSKSSVMDSMTLPPVAPITAPAPVSPTPVAPMVAPETTPTSPAKK